MTLRYDEHARVVARAHAHRAREAVDGDGHRTVDRDFALDGIRRAERSRRERSGERFADAVAERLHAFGEAVGPARDPLLGARTCVVLLAIGVAFTGARVMTRVAAVVAIVAEQVCELRVEAALLVVEIGELALERGERGFRVRRVGGTLRHLRGALRQLARPRRELLRAVQVFAFLVHPLLLFSWTAARWVRTRAGRRRWRPRCAGVAAPTRPAG